MERARRGLGGEGEEGPGWRGRGEAWVEEGKGHWRHRFQPINTSRSPCDCSNLGSAPTPTSSADRTSEQDALEQQQLPAMTHRLVLEDVAAREKFCSGSNSYRSGHRVYMPDDLFVSLSDVTDVTSLELEDSTTDGSTIASSYNDLEKLFSLTSARSDPSVAWSCLGQLLYLSA